MRETKKLKNSMIKIPIVILSIISLYYLLMRGFPFLIISKKIYGPYYFSRVVWIWPHVLGGVLAMALGPFQFISKLRIRYPKIHRMLGIIFLISILISSVTLIPLITTSSSNLVIDIGLGIGGVVWLLAAVFAYIAIRNKNIEQHKEWMIRCYMVTLAFVVFRLAIDLLSYYEVTNEPDIVAISSWVSWTLPLCTTEFIIQGRKIMN
ncbi:DUF2306 domain-containing protein [Tenacibaculum aiptasiae]|uniref:DUF2306 domain-containing protein n=1 Tax=Tenacibaculum aiptasiae TaxID=426481 RepID=A0A7J5A832_9FLAO|nr:DUF2306 domain-containing protein [Tenacibaculum aiptasiae]KAB1153657.1 DUF2306 domain-containing protein [Tenacibaculum aiptasiae]